jgi:colanic acid biosynthesis glycosyl transferase WcaI
MNSMLWILSEVYYPEETGTGYYITRIAEHLALKRPVSVLCAQPAYSRAGVKAPRSETHHLVEIFRCSSLVLHQRSILIRLMRMVSITLSMFLAALFRIRRGDSILAVTNPPSLPILAALLSFILRVRFSLVVHDVYPDIIAACGLTSRKTVFYRLLHKISQLVLQRAELIFCIGRDMCEHLAQTRGTGTCDGIQVIPLWADCQEIQPAPRESNQLLMELGLKNKLVILYAGNMGHPHDIETLAAAIKRLESDERIHFVFIGSGPKQRILDEMLACGSTNISVLPPRPRSAQNEFLNACDVAILSLVPGMLGLAVPSRTYNLMAAGKPIIALVAQSSEVARVVHEEGIGWVVEPGAVEKTMQAIQAARESLKLLLEMGARARQAAETKYSPETILRQFDVFLEPPREFSGTGWPPPSVVSSKSSGAEASEP